MKVRFVAVLAIILMVIGIFVTCFDNANTNPNSSEKEAESTTSVVQEDVQQSEENQTTETTGETQEDETPETESTGETQGAETPSTETTEKPQETEKKDPTNPTDNPTTEKTEETGKTDETEKPKETPSEYFGKDITFKSEYICEEGFMPYALYTPSTINESKKTPLIVWLHGSGEVGVGKDAFFNSGLLKTMNKWRRQGFNAYVICPQLAGNYNTGRWNKESTRDNLQALLDNFIENHNIDTDRIIVVGHSLGGQGALYMAYELPEYFSRCVVLSGYDPGIDIKGIKVPTIGFVGTENAGEDAASVSYMKKYCMEVFGDENIFFMETSHGGVPNAAFSIDTDDDDRSDLVEWMFGEFEF